MKKHTAERMTISQVLGDSAKVGEQTYDSADLAHALAKLRHHDYRPDANATDLERRLARAIEEQQEDSFFDNMPV